MAIKLLDHEPKASKQGQLLLKMKEDKLALKKAIESGDTDFIHLVLMHMRFVFFLTPLVFDVPDKPCLYVLRIDFFSPLFPLQELSGYVAR